MDFKVFGREYLGYSCNELDIDFTMKDIEAFFDASERSAKLIWCTPEQEEVVAKLAVSADYKPKVNCTDLDLIRNMYGYCLIVTESDLMRGIDYRTGKTGETKNNDGIDLLIACPFGNQCEFQ